MSQVPPQPIENPTLYVWTLTISIGPLDVTVGGHTPFSDRKLVLAVTKHSPLLEIMKENLRDA